MGSNASNLYTVFRWKIERRSAGEGAWRSDRVRRARVIVRIVLGTLAAGCIGGLVQLQAGEPPSRGPLATETGRVTYRFSRKGAAGSTVFAWRHGGHLYRQDFQVSRDSETVLGRGPRFWMLNPRARTAQEARRDPNDLWLNADWVPYVTPETGAGEVVGRGEVLGRPCEIRRIHQMQVWFWEGLPLRMERDASSKLERVSLVATRLENAPDLPATHFDIPAGFAITRYPGYRPFPWNTVATEGLGSLLLLIGIGGWAVEAGFTRRERNMADAGALD